MEKSSFEKNIVKSNYTNITQPQEIQKAKSSRRNKWSIFHFMFNTNKSFTDIESDEFKQLEDKLVSAFDQLVGDQGNPNIYNFIVFKEHEAGTHNVRKFKCSAATEVGNDQHRLHLHGLLAFFHNTLIKTNYEKIKKFMESKVGLPLAIWYKVYSKADFNIQNYIMKYSEISSNRKNEDSKEEGEHIDDGEVEMEKI